MKQYKLTTRQYRSITVDNESEELNRQFELIRSDFKDLSMRQRALVKGNIMIMEKLGIFGEKLDIVKNALDKDMVQE